jgi:hypothetical protein
LCDILGVNKKDAKKACKVLLNEQMQMVFSKNRSAVSRGKPSIMIKKLNNKTLEQCVKKIKSRKQRGNPMDRDRDLYGDRRNRMTKRPSNTRRKKRGGLSGTLDSVGGSGGDSGFAPIASGPGGFITATGEMGSSMAFNNGRGGGNGGQMDQFGHYDKRAGQDELERRMMERQSMYEGGGMAMGGMGMMGPNFNNNRRPPEINFALDGSDSRGYGQDKMDDFGMMNGMGGGMEGFDPSMGGMAGMGGGGMMGGMNPGMMGGNMGGNMGGMNPAMMGGMNPMMMQMMQNGMNPMAAMMGGGPTEDSGTGKMDQGEFQARLNQLSSERGGGDMNIPQGGNFNPMMSPNMNPMMMQMMMQANNSNFQMGGKGGAAVNNALSLVQQKKKEVASKLGLDPQAIMNMSADDINDLAHNKIKMMDSDSDDSSDEELPTNKKDLMKMLLNMKKNNMTKNKHLAKSLKSNIKKGKGGKKGNKSKRYDSDSDSSDSEVSEKTTESESESDHSSDGSSYSGKKNRKTVVRRNNKNNSRDKGKTKTPIIKRDKKKRNISDTPDSSDTESATDSSSDSDSSVPPMKVKGKNKGKVNAKEETIALDIHAEEICESSEHYSDYLIQFGDTPINNIKSVDVTNSVFPTLHGSITDKTNKIVLIIDDQTIPIELDPGMYDINYLLEDLTESLADFNIKISKTSKGNIVIENTEKENFSIDVNESTLLKLFGFTGKKYEDNHMYKSTKKNSLEKQPYDMYLTSLNDSKPICKINQNGQVSTFPLKFNKTIGNLDALIVQFKTKDGKLANFGDNSHSFRLEFECVNSNGKSRRR